VIEVRRDERGLEGEGMRRDGRVEMGAAAPPWNSEESDHEDGRRRKELLESVERGEWKIDRLVRDRT